MDNYELIISEGLNGKELIIIKEYWLNEKGAFVHNNIDLSKKYSISSSKLIDLIKEKSLCKITFRKCRKCKKKYNYTVRTKSDFLYVTNRLSFVCNKCTSNPIVLNKYDFDLNKFALITPQYALENHLWEELAPIELEILKKIIYHKQKHLIYRDVFKRDIENKEIWDMIEHIEDLGLIWIVRDESRKIKTFNFLPELEEKLLTL